VAHDTLFPDFFPARFKLRLDQTDTDSLRRADLIRHRENMFERDKGYIHAKKLDFFRQIFRFDIADVGAFHIHDPGIGAQSPGKLSVADVYGIHCGSAVLEHAVGKAAGGSADIHTDFSVGTHGKHFHGLFQLESSAADIADVMPAHFDFGVGRDHLPGFVRFLLIDEHDAGHNESFGPFPALNQAVLAKILIQSDLAHFFFSFICASTSFTSAAASSC